MVSIRMSNRTQEEPQRCLAKWPNQTRTVHAGSELAQVIGLKLNRKAWMLHVQSKIKSTCFIESQRVRTTKSEEKAHQDHTTSQFSYWNQWNSQRQKLQRTKMGTSGGRNNCLYVVRWINTKMLLVDRTLTQLKKPQVIHEIIYFVQSWFEDKDFARVMVSSRSPTRFGEGEMAQTYTGTSSVRKPNLTYMRKAHRR